MKREIVNMKPRRFAMKHLIAAAEHRYVLPKGTIKAGRKTRPVIVARFMVCLIAREELGLSYTQIGQGLGRDHTTVLNAVRSARELVKDEAFAADYEAIVEDAVRRAEKWRELVEVTAEALIPPPEPAPEPEAVAKPFTARKAPAPRRDPFADDISPPRQWWIENDFRFIEAMRRAHPEREIALEVRP